MAHNTLTRLRVRGLLSAKVARRYEIILRSNVSHTYMFALHTNKFLTQLQYLYIYITYNIHSEHIHLQVSNIFIMYRLPQHQRRAACGSVVYLYVYYKVSIVPTTLALLSPFAIASQDEFFGPAVSSGLYYVHVHYYIRLYIDYQMEVRNEPEQFIWVRVRPACKLI